MRPFQPIIGTLQSIPRASIRGLGCRREPNCRPKTSTKKNKTNSNQVQPSPFFECAIYSAFETNFGDPRDPITRQAGEAPLVRASNAAEQVWTRTAERLLNRLLSGDSAESETSERLSRALTE